MPNRLNGFLGQTLQGFLDPKGNMGDFQHAARLYVNDTFRLAPKTKFLYYTVFNINPTVLQGTGFQALSQRELNYLVKKMDLPKFTLNTENLNQYNRKTTSYTRITYEPLNITFHDDNHDTTNSLWALYYGYYFRDRLNSQNPYSDIYPIAYQNNTYQSKQNFPYRYGLDNNQTEPFFRSIQLVTLSRQKFFSYLLCNPRITAWQHDTMDQSDGSGVAQNNMTVAYDAVIYNSGNVVYDNPTGFAVLHYDTLPSPIAGEELIINGFNGIFGNLFNINTFDQQGGLLGNIINSFTNTGNQAPYGADNSLTSSALSPFTTPNAVQNPNQTFGLSSNGSPTSTSTVSRLSNGTPNSTSGFQNYNFGNYNTISGMTGVDRGINVINTAPIDNNFTTNRDVVSQAINNNYSDVTIPFRSGTFISDAYGETLPNNSLGANESASFGSRNTALSIIEPTGSVNSNYFNNANSSNPAQELLNNNPFQNDSDPFS